MSRRASLVAVGVAIRLSAAAIWLVAGAAKLVDLEHFHAQVDQYQLLPHALEAPFACAVPFVELLVGLYLAVGLFTRAAAARRLRADGAVPDRAITGVGARTVARLRLLRRAHP